MKPKEGTIRKRGNDIKERYEMAKQIKKYIAVTTASFMAMQLAACGNTETVEESSATTDPTNNVSEENSTTTAENDLQSVYDSDMANACDEWKESDDGSFECLDENSPHYAQHFFNGLMYATTGALLGSAIYKSRNLRNGTEREDRSGGSGSAVPRTHSNTSDSKNSNGITTNGSQNPSGTTSSSSNNTTTNSSNSTTSGSNSYSSGKRSYSNSSGSSSNQNSYSNHSSSSSGKSGFGSGGASRGGSSSS